MSKINSNQPVTSSPLGDGGLIKAGIVGGAGYTGGELIRLLLNHPHTKISFVHSKSNAKKYLYEVHNDLIGEKDLKFTGESDFKNLFCNSSEASTDKAVLFLCLAHGESKIFLQENEIPAHVKIIDLSNDFRLAESSKLNAKSFVYGLPELNREQIKQAQNIANPGCFATAIQLGLLPLAKTGLLQDVYTTGITGSTGAGQSLSHTSHFSWRVNNIQAYKTLKHQHLNEIYQSLNSIQNAATNSSLGDGGNHTVNFVPWRGDFARGIFISSQLRCEKSLSELYELYENYYSSHPFTHISKDSIFLKQVVNTNKCVIQLEKEGNQLVVHSAIDNLLKGASGQAVQNMNLMFGLNETAGLNLKSAYF